MDSRPAGRPADDLDRQHSNETIHRRGILRPSAHAEIMINPGAAKYVNNR